VHGGVIAETFDEMLGAANMVAGNPGMTGTLTVKYRKPTPLRTDLRIEARCVGRSGRKIRTWAGIYHGEVLTAEADGIFIEVAPARFLAIAEGNADSVDPTVLAAMRAEAARIGVSVADAPGFADGGDHATT
jgi:acyl-coenzyme A thioesterase PaaI-like protein